MAALLLPPFKSVPLGMAKLKYSLGQNEKIEENEETRLIIP